MNNRLDFYNSVKKYNENKEEEESILVLSNSIKVGDPAIINFNGNEQPIIEIVTRNFETCNPQEYELTANIRNLFINSVILLCLLDEGVEKHIIESIKNIKKSR
jgi:hypothetical protein